MPPLEAGEWEKIRLPRTLDHAKDLCQVLVRYRDDYWLEVVILYAASYIFLQSFTIPGSVFLSIIAGALFPFYFAIVLVSLCAAIGASNAFLLSSQFGRRLMQKYFPERVREWQKTVERHRSHLFFYIMFLRLTPLVPNWFVNVASPVVGVPWLHFFLGTFAGVSIPTMFFVRGGAAIQDLTSTSDIVTWRTGLWLTLGGTLLLLPQVFRSRLKEKFA